MTSVPCVREISLGGDPGSLKIFSTPVWHYLRSDVYANDTPVSLRCLSRLHNGRFLSLRYPGEWKPCTTWSFDLYCFGHRVNLVWCIFDSHNKYWTFDLTSNLTGIEIIAVTTCSYFLYKERKFRQNIKWFIYIYILFAGGTIFAGSNAYLGLHACVLDRGYPGGPAEFWINDGSLPIYRVAISWCEINSLIVQALLVLPTLRP